MIGHKKKSGDPRHALSWTTSLVVASASLRKIHRLRERNSLSVDGLSSFLNSKNEYVADCERVAERHKVSANAKPRPVTLPPLLDSNIGYLTIQDILYVGLQTIAK